MSGKIYEIHFRDSPRGREVYRELLKLKERHRAPWVRVLAMLLDAYYKLESGRIDERVPDIPEQPLSIYVIKSRHTYTASSFDCYTTIVREPRWMYKYIGKRLLYVIVARGILYKVVGRVFEEKGEDGTRKYVLADIKITGSHIPESKTLDSIKKSIWAKVNELCNKDYTCRGITIEPELNRIHHIVR